MTTPAIKAATTSGNSREEINIALQQMATSMNQALNPPGIPKAILDAGGGGGLGTAASGKSLAPVPNPNDNPSGYLTNADKVVLVSQWQSERALQVGSASIFAGGTDTVSGAYGTAAYGLLAYGMGGRIGSGDSTLTPVLGSLDYQANSLGISHVAYDSAIQALSDNLLANGAPDNWSSVWPDGTTLTVPGLELALAGWWATVKSARVALQNATTTLVANASTLGGNLVPNGDSSLGPVTGIGGAAVLDTTNSGFSGYQGSRYVRAMSAVTTPITNEIPANYGDVFDLNFVAMIPLASGTSPVGSLENIYALFYDGNNVQLSLPTIVMTTQPSPVGMITWPGQIGLPTINNGTWYAIGEQFSAPVGSVYLKLSILGFGPGTWFDNINLQKTSTAQTATPTALGKVKVGAGLVAALDGTLALTAVPGTPVTASSNAVTYKIPIVIGGVTYYLAASTSAT